MADDLRLPDKVDWDELLDGDVGHLEAHRLIAREVYRHHTQLTALRLVVVVLSVLLTTLIVALVTS